MSEGRSDTAQVLRSNDRGPNEVAMSEGRRGNRLAWLHRRAFLGRSAGGIGSLALAALLEPRLLAGSGGEKAGESPGAGSRALGAVNPLHFPPRIKRII